MATIKPEVKRLDDNTARFTYADLANGDDGTPIGEEWGDFADRTVQVKGAFGTGGNLKVEGALDDTPTFATLNDPFGTALDITAATIEGINEITPLLRPNVSAGDGTTSLTAIFVCRRSRSAKEI